jgi:regulator of RNase E activity RraB
MRYLALMLMLQQLATVDPQRIENELAADADVLRSLRDDGDDPNIVRPVDVRFVGERANIAALEARIGSTGWRVVQRVTVDNRSEALDVQREQATDPASIRRLTEAALEIEGRYGVEYDGWGTVATKR